MSSIGIIYGVAAIFGAVIGSFLTLLTYRLPRNEPIGMTRSRCPHCLKALRIRDLVPILSWVTARGRCRQCAAPISWRYPLTEVACALGAVGALWHAGVTLEALALAGLCWCVVAIIITDLEHYIILDEVQVALALLGALYQAVQGSSMSETLIAGFVGLAIGLALKYGFLYFRNKDALGLGDVKLLFGVGIWLGSAANFVPFLFFSGVAGIVLGSAWRLLGRGQLFPFGPALAVVLLLCVVWPPLASQFWQLYGFLPAP